jgi:hypothetical protein
LGESGIDLIEAAELDGSGFDHCNRPLGENNNPLHARLHFIRLAPIPDSGALATGQN